MLENKKTVFSFFVFYIISMTTFFFLVVLEVLLLGHFKNVLFM